MNLRDYEKLNFNQRLQDFIEKYFRLEPIFIFLIIFQCLIGIISWINFFKAANDPNLIYNSLKSYFLPLELKGPLKEALASVSQVTVPDLNVPYFQVSFSQLKIKSFYKICEELSRWLIISVYALSFFLIFRLKSLLKLNRSQLFFYASLLFLVGALCLPNDSSDLYGYVARGAQQLYWAQNPFASVVSEIENWRQNIFLVNMQWENNPAPYGPLFMLLCKLLLSLSFGNFCFSLFLFKIVNICAFFIMVKLLMSFITGEEAQKRLFLLLAFNPFFFMEVAWNGHNDVLMCLFICLSFYFMRRENAPWAVLMLSLAILIKYLAIVLLPLLCIVLILKLKSLDRKASINLLLFSVLSLSLVAFFTFYYDLLNIDYSRFNKNLTLSHKSLFNTVSTLSESLMGYALPATFKYIFIGAFIIFAFSIYWKFFKTAQNALKVTYTEDLKAKLLTDSLITYSFLLMAVLVLLLSPKFHSWYLLSFLPFGFISFPAFSLVLSFTHLLSFTFIDQANILNFLVMTVLAWFITRRVFNRRDSLVQNGLVSQSRET